MTMIHSLLRPLWLVAAVILIAALATRAAQAAEPMTLKEGSWVCGTQDALHEARQGAWSGPRFSIAKFRKGTQEQEACLYVDDDLLEDMMAPFVTVLQRDGDEAMVSFIVEYYKRIEYLHRKFSRVQITGWTDAANVEIRVP